MTYNFVALPIQLSTHDEEPMNFKPVDVALSKSATQIIFESLRHSIILGEMEDGASLRQEEIAKAFNSSRIPVREAIVRLEQLGLVEMLLVAWVLKIQMSQGFLIALKMALMHLSKE